MRCLGDRLNKHDLMEIRILFKIFKWLGVLLAVILLVAPLAVYWQGLKMIDEMPQKPINQLTQDEVNAIWASKEICEPEECRSITPFWFYRWLIVAYVNDFIRPVEVDAAYHNYSKMAGHIANNYLRAGHFKKSNHRMMWWHFTNICLTIWIQRNWSEGEIATAYKQIQK